MAIGNAYYPDNRTVSSNISKFSIQIGTDMAANILKEFWPDLDRMFGDCSPLRHAAVEKPSDRWMLFGSKTSDDEPLIKRASPPRPPLAVRRATPEVPRLRAEQPRGQTLDLALEPDHSSPKSNGLTPGTSYTFQVRAYGTLGYTDYSDAVIKIAT